MSFNVCQFELCETLTLEYQCVLDIAYEISEHLLRGTVTEHDIFLTFFLIEHEEAFMHSVKQLDVLAICELKLRVHLLDIHDDHTNDRRTDEYDHDH